MEMKNIKEEIASEITEKILNHISVVYDDVDETMNLIENLPLVVKYKKRIKELEMRLIDANKTILLLKSDLSNEKNLHLEVFEKLEPRQIITKDDIEKSLEEQESKTFTIDYGLSGLNDGLWNFNDDDDAAMESDNAAMESDNAAMESDNGEENDDANEIGSEVYDMLKAIKEKVNLEKLDNCETVINNEVEDDAEEVEEVEEEDDDEDEDDADDEDDAEEVEEVEEEDDEDGDSAIKTQFKLFSSKAIKQLTSSADDNSEVEKNDTIEKEDEIYEEEGIESGEEDIESGEEEDFVVEEILLNNKKYYTNDPKNGIIFEYLEDEEIGEEIGYLENGQLFIS